MTMSDHNLCCGRAAGCDLGHDGWPVCREGSEKSERGIIANEETGAIRQSTAAAVQGARFQE